MPDAVLVKATPLLSLVSFLEGRLSADAWERVLTDAERDYPDAVQKIRKQRVLATERFPVALLNQMVEKAASEVHQSPENFAHLAGRHGAESAAGGILRLALAMISMPSLLRKLQPVWGQLYSHGRTTNECGDKNATVELHDFPYVSSTQCARVTGMFEWFAQKAEPSAQVRHIACRARGDGSCRWSIDW